jgi:DNA-binding MarR family transcriptional regulator
MKTAPVDLMIEQWTQQRPDLDSSSLGVLARIARLARLAEENAAQVLGSYSLSEAEFQLLAAVRTSPEPLSPRDLLEPLMVTSGGLTNRIDRLERAGLVERLANPQDRRGVHLKLTHRGLEIVDRVTTEYLANQNAILDDALEANEREILARLLQCLLASLTATLNGGKAGTERSSTDRPPVAYQQRPNAG